MTRLARAAVAYAARLQWPVFPLLPRGKDPLIPKARGGNGFLDATLNLETIKAWWSRWPNANVGIACDDRSALLVVDVDPRNGGDASLAELEARYGELPSTITGLTGGGGQHYVYRRPAGVNLRGKLAEGIDIKHNGYIVAPPSIHPNGRAYGWDAARRPLETELAELPSWVLRRILSLDPDVQYGQSADNAAQSFLARAFAHAGWLGKRIDAVRISCLCPWENEHTQKSGSGGTVIFAPRAGSGAGWFHCAHTSHGRKSMRDVMDVLPYEACRLAAADIVEEAANDACAADDYADSERLAIVLEDGK